MTLSFSREPGLAKIKGAEHDENLTKLLLSLWPGSSRTETGEIRLPDLVKPETVQATVNSLNSIDHKAILSIALPTIKIISIAGAIVGYTHKNNVNNQILKSFNTLAAVHFTSSPHVQIFTNLLKEFDIYFEKVQGKTYKILFKTDPVLVEYFLNSPDLFTPEGAYWVMYNSPVPNYFTSTPGKYQINLIKFKPGMTLKQVYTDLESTKEPGICAVQ